MKALLLIDLQKDFAEGGALAIPGASQVVPLINQLQQKFGIIVATKDWHPPNHQSFVDQHPGKQIGETLELHGMPQQLWPPHCVQGSEGAQFMDGLNSRKISQIFFTGTEKDSDCFSGFGNGLKMQKGLYPYLKDRRVERVYIAGLATDYYVKNTAIDAVKLGFETYVVSDACKAVNLYPGDEGRAFAEMIEAGVNIIRSEVL
jgi:nicotinamidase/pyrazinamidase